MCYDSIKVRNETVTLLNILTTYKQCYDLKHMPIYPHMNSKQEIRYKSILQVTVCHIA